MKGTGKQEAERQDDEHEANGQNPGPVNINHDGPRWADQFHSKPGMWLQLQTAG